MPRVFLTRFEKEEDVAAFSFTQCIKVLSVGEPHTADFSAEVSENSDISSRSRIPVEVGKSWPYSTEVFSLVNLVFPFNSLPRPARFSSRVKF